MSEPERELLRQVDEILFRASVSALEGGNADADALITDARVKLMALGPPMTARDRIAAVIYDSFDDYAKKLLVKPHLPGAADIEGDGKPFCYRVADALIAAGVTMPAPPCPEWVRFGGKVINCQGRDGHEGECW